MNAKEENAMKKLEEYNKRLREMENEYECRKAERNPGQTSALDS